MMYQQWAVALVLTSPAAGSVLRSRDDAAEAPADRSCKRMAEAMGYQPMALSFDPDTFSIIKPSLYVECAKGVKPDKERDQSELEYIQQYIQFHSTLELLANPPEGYPLPPVDVLDGFKQLHAKLEVDGYDSQWDWSNDLSKLFQQASDEHFRYEPPMKGPLTVVSNISVVSVSEDGLSPPKVYLRADLLDSLEQDYDASAIDAINDVPVDEFLEDLSFQMRYHDPDAKYNSLFWRISLDRLGVNDMLGLTFPDDIPDYYNVTFANGSTLAFENLGYSLLTTLSMIRSPEALHAEVELPADPMEAPPIPALVEPPRNPERIPGYPEPEMIHPFHMISGYFLEGDGFEDTAVLGLHSNEYGMTFEEFINYDGADPLIIMRNQLAEFIVTCKEQNKTKLVIDVSGNGGGFNDVAAEIIQHFFPKKPEEYWDGHRMRATPALDIIGEATFPGNIDTLVFPGQVPIDTMLFSIPELLDTNGAILKSWDAQFGPEEILGMNVTKIDQLNYGFLADRIRPTFVVRGFNDSDPIEDFEPPFKRENLVLVSDGTASSGGAHVTRFFQNEGVRTVAMGGRPIEAPMQPAGGTRGQDAVLWPDIRNEINNQIGFAIYEGRMSENDTRIDELPLTRSPLRWGLNFEGRINLRNAYDKDDQDGYPVQFKYSPAHCRLFYTGEMMRDIGEVWRRVADVAWGEGRCVGGSSTGEDGRIGDEVPGFTEKAMGKRPGGVWPGTEEFGDWVSKVPEKKPEEEEEEGEEEEGTNDGEEDGDGEDDGEEGDEDVIADKDEGEDDGDDEVEKPADEKRHVQKRAAAVWGALDDRGTHAEETFYAVWSRVKKVQRWEKITADHDAIRKFIADGAAS